MKIKYNKKQFFGRSVDLLILIFAAVFLLGAFYFSSEKKQLLQITQNELSDISISKDTKALESKWYFVEQAHVNQLIRSVNKKASYAAILGAFTFLVSLLALLGGCYNRDQSIKNKLLTSQKKEEEYRRMLAEIRTELWSFSAKNSLDKTLKEMLDKVCAITDSAFAFLFFLDENQETISLSAWSSKVDQQPISLAGVWKEAIKTKKPHIHNNSQDREIVVPVLRDKRIIAVMGVANKATLYDSNDLFLCSYLADVVLEISRAKFKEDALQKSEEKYRSFFHDHSAMNVIIDPSNGSVVDANRSAVEFYGWTLEELKKMNISDINVLPFDQVKKLAQSALSSANSMFELQQKRADGSFVDIDVFVGRVEIDGRPLIYANIHDITLKKYREKAQDLLYNITKVSMNSISLEDLVTTLKDGLSNLLDASNLYIALYDNERTMFRVEDFSKQNFNGVHWLSMTSVIGHVFTTKSPLLLGSNEIAPFLSKHNLSTPFPIPKCLLCLPLVYDGNSLGVLALKSFTNSKAYNQDSLRFMDMVAHELSVAIARFKLIEDLVHARSKAEESNRLKSAFISNLSHEVRTPVNAIVGFLDLLSDPDLNNKYKELSLEQIKIASERLTKTLNNLIEVSKIDAGIVNINLSYIDVNQLLKNVYEQFCALSASKRISLRLNVKVPNNQSTIKSDESKILAILSELLANSFEFSKKGTIEIGNYIDGDKICFYVNDTGCGIEPSKIDSLFNYFEVIDSGYTREYKGIGLGLPIVKSYVESLGGSIKAHSEVGKLTSIHFYLPIKANIINR